MFLQDLYEFAETADNEYIALLDLLDKSVAVDVIEHKIFERGLEKSYRARECAISWIASYSIDTFQHVALGKCI